MHNEVLKSFLLVTLLVIVISLQAFGLVDLSGVHVWVEDQAEHWWAPAALVTLMIVLYAFALPASTLMLVAGVMYTPLQATGWTILGGALGGLAAYHVARHLTDWGRRNTASPLFTFMKSHSGLLLWTALRILPGFPHSAINYSAGILRMNALSFIMSTVLGYAVKGYVYTSAVYHATHVESEADAFSAETLWPLVALSVLMIAALFVRKRYFRSEPGTRPG